MRGEPPMRRLHVWITAGVPLGFGFKLPLFPSRLPPTPHPFASIPNAVDCSAARVWIEKGNFRDPIHWGRKVAVVHSIPAHAFSPDRSSSIIAGRQLMRTSSSIIPPSISARSSASSSVLHPLHSADDASNTPAQATSLVSQCLATACNAVKRSGRIWLPPFSDVIRQPKLVSDFGEPAQRVRLRRPVRP